MKRGFTLIELLIFIAIFTLVMVAFTTILVAVTNVQTQQVAQNEVTGQSQFLLQQLQYYIEQSSLVDMTTDAATTTLRLRMAATSTDPTIITLTSGTVYLQQGSGPQVPLTSSRVTVSGLSFIKRSNPPAHDSVSIAYTLAYNTSNLIQEFSQGFQTSIARVSAANFDSNILPSSTATYSLGQSGATWTSINGIIDFSGTNVGINQASPAEALEINGGIRLNTAVGTSTCNAAIDGTFWVVQGANNVKDSVVVCAKDASNAYAWRTIY